MRKLLFYEVDSRHEIKSYKWQVMELFLRRIILFTYYVSLTQKPQLIIVCFSFLHHTFHQSAEDVSL